MRGWRESSKYHGAVLEKSLYSDGLWKVGCVTSRELGIAILAHWVTLQLRELSIEFMEDTIDEGRKGTSIPQSNVEIATGLENCPFTGFAWSER